MTPERDVLFEIERLESEIKRLRGEVDELASKNQRAMKLVTRREAARQAAEKVRNLLVHYENEAKSEVQGAVNQILAKVARLGLPATNWGRF